MCDIEMKKNETKNRGIMSGSVVDEKDKSGTPCSPEEGYQKAKGGH